MQGSTRKGNRLPIENYQHPHAFFLTICTDGRRCLFRKGDMTLTEWGKMVQEAIKGIPHHYAEISVLRSVVMPNHVHMLLQLHGEPMEEGTVSIPIVVRMFKRAVSIRAGHRIWQKGYYDHIARREEDFLEITAYIDNNLRRWREDGLYRE